METDVGLSASLPAALLTVANLAVGLISHATEEPVRPGLAPAAKAAGAGGATAARLTNAQLVGQRLVVGLPGTKVPETLARRIRRGRVAGVILFAHNAPSRSAVRALTRRLQAVRRPARIDEPLLVMVDQEGGQVKRLPGPPRYSAEQMGRLGARSCRREGTATGRYLRRTGVNVDLAPVLDVARDGSAIAAEDRAFGKSKARVTRCGMGFAKGLERKGVVATGKHFPGLGAARRNTDFAVQRIGLSRKRLRRVDEAPYRRFAGRGARGRLVMVGSAVYPAFSNRPASFTRSLATVELRRRLGFRGASVSDALNTESAEAFGGPGTVARKVAKAGTDLLLYTDLRRSAKASRALKRALEEGKIRRRNFVRSAERVLELRSRLRRG